MRIRLARAEVKAAESQILVFRLRRAMLHFVVFQFCFPRFFRKGIENTGLFVRKKRNGPETAKTPSLSTGRLVGEGGFEPPKSVTTDLQSAPFGRSGIPPYEIWSWWTDSNPRPADYKSAALPAELHQQFQQQDLF